MTADQPQPPDSESPIPELPPTSTNSEPVPTIRQGDRSRVKSRVKNAQFPVKAATIQVLRATIQLLEGIVAQLEATPGERPTSPPPAGPLMGLAQITRVWQTVLTIIRAFIPRSLNRKLSDRVLTGAIGLIIIIITGITFSQKSPKPTAIANIPPAQSIVESSPQPTPTIIAENPPITSPEITTPEEQLTTSEVPPINEEKPTVAPPPKIVAELTAPSAPEPVKIETAPPPQLTAEQYLINSIQTQITALADQTITGIIQSIKPNFTASLLTVNFTNSWYQLQSLQQDKLANQILQKSQELDFNRLTIKNSEGRVIARSPMVGTDMIILERQSSVIGNY